MKGKRKKKKTFVSKLSDVLNTSFSSRHKSHDYTQLASPNYGSKVEFANILFENTPSSPVQYISSTASFG